LLRSIRRWLLRYGCTRAHGASRPDFATSFAAPLHGMALCTEGVAARGLQKSKPVKVRALFLPWEGEGRPRPRPRPCHVPGCHQSVRSTRKGDGWTVMPSRLVHSSSNSTRDGDRPPQGPPKRRRFDEAGTQPPMRFVAMLAKKKGGRSQRRTIPWPTHVLL
jgi:hypothetical protein